MKSIVGSMLALALVSCGSATTTSTCSPPCSATQVCVSGSCFSPTTDAGQAADAGQPAVDGGHCTASCALKCEGASDSCGGVCPAAACDGCCDTNGSCVTSANESSTRCGLAGGLCIACTSGMSCNGGACAAICTASCAGKCIGADNGCGSPCTTGSCAGCCDGNKACQPGSTSALCGVSGATCSNCGANNPCQSGSCCTLTAEPTCHVAAVSNGCGGSYPANCTSDCCSGACCAAGQSCDTGGACCTPQCAGKCKGAADGCGSFCPTDGCAGCCDTNNACQPGTTNGVCGANGVACASCSSPAYCGTPIVPCGSFCLPRPGPNQCCTPQCSGLCPGAPDGCGGSCQTNQCAGCCDSSSNCQAGNTTSVCGGGGATCTACSGASCVNNQCGTCINGHTQTVACGACSTEPQTCSNGVWATLSPGCTTYCSTGCCAANGTTCNAGTANTACGNNDATCVDCTSLDTGNGQVWVCGGDNGGQRCALAAGSPVACGGGTPINNTGTCYSYHDWWCSTDNCGFSNCPSNVLSSCCCQ